MQDENHPEPKIYLSSERDFKGKPVLLAVQKVAREN